MNDFSNSEYTLTGCGLFDNSHRYSLSAIGIKMRTKTFNTRKDAENCMNKFCLKRNISIECTECDRHERTYSSDRGISFFINRVY